MGDGYKGVEMKYSRRSFPILLPALAAGLKAQEPSKRLPSRVFKFEDLPTKNNATSTGHAVLDGQTHSGFPIEAHVTELPAGKAPHPPHKHVHEEMFMVQTGILDVTVNGKKERVT